MIAIRAQVIRLLRSTPGGWFATAVGVAITTAVIGQIQSMSHPQNVSILYLLVILGSAIAYGTYPSIFAALASMAVYEYFFEVPVGSFDPGDAEAWLEILLFLIVAVVSSQLATQQRRRADEAHRREEEATALYTLNSLIVWGDEPGVFVTNVFRAFNSDLSLVGLGLYAPNALGELIEIASEGNQGGAAVRLANAAHSFGATNLAVDLDGITGTVPSAYASRRRSGWIYTSSGVTRQEAMYFPIHVENRLVGVLEIIRSAGETDLTDTQRRFLRVVCQQFGIALERARLHQEAAEAAALRRSEEVKTAFLNSVTHDLRTPLAMIKASAGSLRQRDVDWTDDERDSFAGSIERNVDRLDVIVGNLLDISRIDAGMVHPERQYYPLTTLLDDVLGRLDSLLVDYVVTVDVPDNLPPVPIDYVAIDRVLSNLLENVTRHTPFGTQITISALERAGEVIVSVSDNGPGIPAAQVAHLFDRFYRGQPTRPDARRGTGLGLAVVKGLVEAHGGVARVVSQVGVGSTLTFSLPLGPRHEIVADREHLLIGVDR